MILHTVTRTLTSTDQNAITIMIMELDTSLYIYAKGTDIRMNIRTDMDIITDSVMVMDMHMGITTDWVMVMGMHTTMGMITDTATCITSIPATAKG